MFQLKLKYGTSFKIKIINKIQMYLCRKKAKNSSIMMMMIIRGGYFRLKPHIYCPFVFLVANKKHVAGSIIDESYRQNQRYYIT